MEVLGGLCALFGVEPEIVWNHLLKPHPIRILYSICFWRGEHGHSLRTLGVTVDEWVIQDLCHSHTACPSASKNRPLQYANASAFVPKNTVENPFCTFQMSRLL